MTVVDVGGKSVFVLGFDLRPRGAAPAGAPPARAQQPLA